MKLHLEPFDIVALIAYVFSIAAFVAHCTMENQFLSEMLAAIGLGIVVIMAVIMIVTDAIRCRRDMREFYDKYKKGE